MAIFSGKIIEASYTNAKKDTVEIVYKEETKAIVYYIQTNHNHPHFQDLIKEYPNKKFSIDSIKLIYSLPKESFILINDEEMKIYLAFIKEIINENKITEVDFKNYLLKSNSEIRDTLYSSYDIFLSKKYEIKVFQNTIERLKNNFR